MRHWEKRVGFSLHGFHFIFHGWKYRYGFNSIPVANKKIFKNQREVRVTPQSGLYKVSTVGAHVFLFMEIKI